MHWSHFELAARKTDRCGKCWLTRCLYLSERLKHTFQASLNSDSLTCTYFFPGRLSLLPGENISTGNKETCQGKHLIWDTRIRCLVIFHQNYVELEKVINQNQEFFGKSFAFSVSTGKVGWLPTFTCSGERELLQCPKVITADCTLFGYQKLCFTSSLLI